jgi:aldehyde:ferredoxin oxidoreductase
MKPSETHLFGYAGRLLRVNLTNGNISEEILDRQILHDYIGGTGLGVRFMYEEVSPATDPLGPDAKLMFFTGPVTASRLGTAGRYQACFLSPLTGILCDSSSGGHWGARFKQSGYDGLIIEGAAARPVYLVIDNGKVEIRAADHLWGKDTFETQDIIQTEVDAADTCVICIGLAGERQVLYAGIMNDAARCAARGGGGAVMGSKNLKAIAVSGTSQVDYGRP